MKPVQSIQKFKGIHLSSIRDNNSHKDDYLLIKQIDNCILAIVADGVSSCTSGLIASCIGSNYIANYLEQKITETVGQINYYTLLYQAFKKTNYQLGKFTKLIESDFDTAMQKLDIFNLHDEEIAQIKTSIQSDLENGKPLTFKSTFNVNLIVPFDHKYIIYNLCGGDSPSFFIDNLFNTSKTSIRPLYTNGVISSYFNNIGNYSMPHIGSTVFSKGQKLIICSDGVNLFYEDTPIKRRRGGITLLEFLRKEKTNFCSAFYDLRVNQNAIFDDYSCILIDFFSNKHTKQDNAIIQKKTIAQIPIEVNQVRKKVEHNNEQLLQLEKDITLNHSQTQQFVQDTNSVNLAILYHNKIVNITMGSLLILLTITTLIISLLK